MTILALRRAMDTFAVLFGIAVVIAMLYFTAAIFIR
jgi:hypothetical protein